jgi:DNA-binding transcriptional LysR family regulator
MRHLRILYYVDQVARAGSIRKAAERLNVTASAVNRRIMDLEEELGAALFDVGSAVSGLPPPVSCSCATPASRTPTWSA